MNNFSRLNLGKDCERELKSLERSRIITNLLLVLFIVINAAAFAVFVVFLVLFLVKIVKGDFNIVFLALFVGAVVLSLLDNLWFLFKVIRKRRAWRTRFRGYVLPLMFSKLFDDVEYYPDRGIEEATVRSSNIIGGGNIYQSRDLLSAGYKGVRFVRADVCIKFAPSVGGEVSGSAVGISFKGQWMIFDFNKPIDAYVRVFERSLIKGNSLLGIMLKSSPTFKRSIGATGSKVEGGQKVQVEDIAFNKKFEIVTHNPHTAFYILTPTFIEAVKLIERQTEGQLILAFFNGQLHIALNTGENDFRPKLSCNCANNVSLFEKQVLKIAKFIDTLRLDNDYFKQ